MDSSQQLRVIKRDGTLQDVSYDKIVKRLVSLANETPAGKQALHRVNPLVITQKVISQIYDKIHTSELDEQAALVAIEMTTTDPQYGELAGRIVISNHHKRTYGSVMSVFRELRELYDDNNKLAPLVSEELMAVAEEHEDRILKEIDYERDYLIDYFGFRTLERAYLLKNKGRILERPQHMWMRVAIGIHGWDIDKVIQTYHDLSLKLYTHATPTLFNAGTCHPQMSSCFLVAMKDDSIDGIYQTARECALISKWGGGIGLHIHNIRAKGSYIRGTAGTSNGIVPMLRVFNATARYCDQGGGRRKGSFAIYMEPWHRDIEDFLKLRLNNGYEEERARDLFYAMWIPDLFMKRVQENGEWTLFCPDRAKMLADTYGDEFEKLYLGYEERKDELDGKTIKAQKLWFQILQSQIETGTPYLLYKDACNKKSNQKNLGTIKSSNLCTEVLEYSNHEETAVCNLGSLNLQAFIGEDGSYNFDLLREVTKRLVCNLDRVIDKNFYPTEATRRSNFRHRPIGIGVQGLADVFARMKYPYDSPSAMHLNKRIFAHIYFAALESSVELAKEKGTYETFKGSPTSKGIIQPDMWDVKPEVDVPELDWKSLRKAVKGGIRNSLLVAPMPTASTSQILGNNESFEPFTTNIYSRRTIAGEFVVVNQHLVNELLELELWNRDMKDKIIANRGSIKDIEEIPKIIRDRYPTIWEISQKALINAAADRGAYICQSQSLNLYSAEPTFRRLSSMHFYAWSKGLKTGQYYLRTKPVAEAQQFTIEPTMVNKSDNTTKEDEECLVCSA